MPCPIAQSLELVGDWWTLLIVRDAFFFEATRFEEFRRRLGIPTNVLTNRLQSLVDHGILERHAAPQGRSPHAYRLTTKGEALWPVLAALVEWGNEWALDDETDPIVLVHRACGTPISGSRCLTCNEMPPREQIDVEGLSEYA